ncbi:hypothetical protein T484DRAFT_1863461 [Baffinella frigidus]|nr:hypothetical protein T484DRAFT_1863461 [Cryptophyta sp. CCMP2293]
MAPGAAWPLESLLAFPPSAPGAVGIIPWIFVSQRCVEGLFFWIHLAVSQDHA